MIGNGDWVVLKEDNPQGGRAYGRKGQYFKISRIAGRSGIITLKNGQQASIKLESCKKLPVLTRYFISLSERGRQGNWTEPYNFTCNSLEEFRREIRSMEAAPEHYYILSKKKFTIPYQDPNEEVILEDELPVAGNIPVVGRANPPVLQWAVNGQVDWDEMRVIPEPLGEPIEDDEEEVEDEEEEND